MREIKTLHIAQIFFKILMGLSVIGILFILVVFIHSEFSPQTYNKVIVNKENYNLSYNINTPPAPATYDEYKKSNNENIYYNKLSSVSKVILIIRIIISLIFTFLIINQLLNFINSVKNYSTFYGNNSKYFQKMGKYFSILLLFQILFSQKTYTIVFPDYAHTYLFIEFNLTPYIFLGGSLILCLIISQVFKEGEQLRIENDLTV